jgi:alginate O-acetyltransferase complex protein AlgI
MALGVAIALGVKLPQNFNKPYLATSLVDFWTRWHITLSKWLRDYLYIPMGGNRNGITRQIFYVFVTMAIGGIWHGASWNFILWGIAHGAGISVVHIFRSFIILKNNYQILRVLKILITFHFVVACWILFRSPDLITAWRVATGPFIAPSGNLIDFIFKYGFQIALLIFFFLIHPWDDHRSIRLVKQRMPKVLYLPVVLLIFLLAITVSEGSSAKFIYFDF